MILGLLPVRNGGEALRSWLDAAGRWCDALIALDDGSTDDTRTILEASSLVVEVLSHPVRPTFEGWDDAANRAELLAAAGRHRPDWIIWVDADEQLSADDAAALRAFVAGDALPGVAYGFRHCRMWGADRYDPRTPFVYRLFAWQADHVLPDERLHFNPVPLQIPRQAWVRTSLRLRHFGASDHDRIDQRAHKYAEADPTGEFPIDFGNLDRPPERTVAWVERAPDEVVVLGPDDAIGPAVVTHDVGRTVDDADRPLVAALLPVRNGEADLPDWFRSVALLADAVVALDDGSTDNTRALLEAEPLVVRLLRRPVRPNHVGWDDARNRQLLLDAAGELRPRWVLYVDADERFTPDDAAALRAFLETDARPGLAYGFRVHRMVGDATHYDRGDLWVYRLFAWEPGLRLPEDRLHFVPVPQSIDRAHWVDTTIRLQHYGGATPQRRDQRFRKYREADPGLEFQADYGHLLDAPGPLQRWTARPAGAPVVLTEAATAAGPLAPVGPDDDADIDLDAPVLSVVVIGRDDRERILQTLASVVEQELAEPFEVIAVVSGTDGGGAEIRERFPTVTVVDLGPGPALPGKARNAGLALARGDFVSFPGSHTVVPPGSLAARVRAHELGYPMVTGSLRNANFTPAGWASYFLDHASVLPASPSGELSFAPPHCSYDRGLLMREGGFPEHLRAGEDTVVNTAMFRRGLRAWRATDVELFHASPCRDLPGLVGHHFRRGRGLGRIMVEAVEPGRRLLHRATIRQQAVGYIPRRLRATRNNVARYGDAEMREQYRRVRPLVVAGVVAAWAGTWGEVLRPAPGKLRALVGTPAVHVVLAGLDRRDGFAVGRTDVILMARIDVLRGRVVLLAPPRDLLVEVPGMGIRRLNEAYGAGAVAGRSDARHGEVAGGEDPDGDERAGLRLVAETIEHLLGLRVDATVMVDFAGFVRLVDAVGGVEVDAEHAIDDEFVGEDGTRFAAHFPAGPQWLDGEAALTYARTRMADGDRWRRDRHLQLVTALGASAGRGWRSALAAARAARGSVRAEGSRTRMVVGAVGAARALRTRAVRTVTLTPPVVQSVQLEDLGWAHVGIPEAMDRELRARFLQ